MYVSCGDAWNDPRLNKAEQQKRLLLANLTSDIAQIRQYCALRKPESKSDSKIILKIEFQVSHAYLDKIECNWELTEWQGKLMTSTFNVYKENY